MAKKPIRHIPAPSRGGDGSKVNLYQQMAALAAEYHQQHIKEHQAERMRMLKEYSDEELMNELGRRSPLGKALE